MILIYIVCRNQKEATTIGRHLLQQKLAACVNIFPVASLSWWQKKIVTSREVVLLVKTTKRHYRKIESVVKRFHSYTTPAICAWTVDKAERKYLAWLNQTVK